MQDHYFKANNEDSSDRFCSECGKYLTHQIHLRGESSSPASDGYIPSDGEILQRNRMFCAVQALKQQGWQDIMYCPKDGTLFWSISAGSTGVHETYYEGVWPKGSWWINDAGDTWPARPILWKAKGI